MRNIFLLSILFISFITLSSCQKEDAYAIKCVGDDCQQKTIYPKCIDDYTLIISDDPGIPPVLCPNGCSNGQCIQECTDSEKKCINDQSQQICMNGRWITAECIGRCVDGECIDQPVLCQEGEQRCSDLNIETCTNGQWAISETCDLECLNGKCASCKDGALRCSDLNVEACINGSWIIQETCLYGCQNGSCSEGCFGPDYCQDSSTLMQCVGNIWISVSCRNGCKDDKCQPDVQEEVDHRLTNKLCSEDEDGDPGICNHHYGTNELGSVCVDAGPSAYFCLPRCDPNKPTQNYYCADESWSAVQGECQQISDGSYAIIPTHVDECHYTGCSFQNGCTTIYESYEISPASCDYYENYCEGTIVHECISKMETYDCREEGDNICVQFWSNIFCATPCEVEGDVYYVCSPGYKMIYSTSVTCVPDDNGVLSWQYNHGVTNECPNGCNETTGLCN